MRQLRGICIGAGYFSQFHFDAWRRIPEADIVAVCDLDPAKAHRASELFPGATATVDVGEALDRFQPDFVDIITPPATHQVLVEAAAKRGIQVICQKALAPTFEEAQAIVSLANSHGIRLMVHENFRFQPWHREIRRLIEAGVVGDRLHQIHFRSRLGDGWGPNAYLDRQPYFREMPQLLIYETGVHFIDVFRYLAGEIEETYAILRRLNPVIRGEDCGLVTFRFANGATGVWDANRYNDSSSGDARYTFGEALVEGSGGSIRLYSDGRLTVQELGGKERDHAYVHHRRGFAGDCVYFTQREFVACMSSGRAFETSGDEYLKTLRVQQAVYSSAERNLPIHIDQESRSHRRPGKRIVDLSLPVDNAMPGVRISPFTTIAERGWTSSTLSLYSHSGTHMDAPKHFLADDKAASIDQQSLATCLGSAKIINLTPVGPHELISLARLTEELSRTGMNVEAGDRLLLRTDWWQQYGGDGYRNDLPRISRELACWLVERKVALIGVEAPSVADVNSLPEVTEIHQILFRGGIVIVEGLANLHTLRQPVVEFVALPMRIVDGDGSPVRAIALEDVP